MASYYDRCWTERWIKKYRKLAKARDVEGARALRFGRYMCVKRDGRTQAEAATLAKMNRADWIQYENGHALPPKWRIKAIAEGLGIENEVALLAKAGYAVPKESALYDKREARRKFREALEGSETLAQFLFRMQEVWEDFLLEMRYGEAAWPPSGAPKRSAADVLRSAEGHLTVGQRLQLARELVRPALERRAAVPAGVNPRKIYGDITEALEAFRGDMGI